MLQTDLAAARAVFDNPDATQGEIDSACTKLQTTLSELENHEFVLPVVSMTANGKALSNGMTYEAIGGVLNIDVAIAGTMYKTFELTTDNEVGVTSAISENKDSIVLTKTAESGTVTVSARVVDDYDRETTYTYNITVVDKLVAISSIYITLDGQKVDSVTKSGYSLGYRDFSPFTLEYKTDDVGCAEPTNVEWTSTSSEYISIDSTGKVDLTLAGRAKAINNTNITCTVTNADGTKVQAKIPVQIKR